jgi:hypothetical protein
MHMPGFTAKISLEKASNHYRSSGARTAPSGIAPSVNLKPCPNGSESSGCPSGTYCAEPGGPPFACSCLRCASYGGNNGGGKDWWNF